MKILSLNPAHDGAISYVRGGKLILSIEAEKNSNYRYSPVSSQDVFDTLCRVDEVPDVLSTGGWWPREGDAIGSNSSVGYRGVDPIGFAVGSAQLLGKAVKTFSSSHERSHILCAFGMSDLPKGTPCYALVWEGAIGAFYKIDPDMSISLISNVLNEPGNRYTSIYGLADPTFPKNAPFSRFSDAGKLMALASFSTRTIATDEEEVLMSFLLSAEHVQLNLYDGLEQSPYYNSGVDDPEFRNFAGIFSDRIFQTFCQFADSHLDRDLPLVIAGGCGLNCDWNSKWRASGLFSSVFVPPVANDSGSAIGTAIDAQLYFTGNPKLDWDVYSGLPFDAAGAIDLSRYDTFEKNDALVAELLANDLILAWVNGRYEIGPRALGNRSILAAPFSDHTRVRLNEIKQREQFRPIAPICLQDDASRWFDCHEESPHMLYTYQAATPDLRAVTHVNGTARLQTVSPSTNRALHELLSAFKRHTGCGVLCNTSLNFNGRGFINNISDLAKYADQHALDGFVVDGKAYLRKASPHYLTYLGRSTSGRSQLQAASL